MLLGVGASLQFFRGPRALARRVATLRALDLRVSLGMAPTAGAWLLLAQRERRACRRVLTLPTLVRRLDALPLACCPARPRLDWLGTSAAPRWATCAPCRAPACSGAARPNCWRRWTPPGLAPEPQRWIEPPARFARRIELMEYLEHTRRGAGRGPPAGRTAGRLAGREPAGGAQDHAQPGARARPPRAPATELELALSQPTWQPAQILGLLRELAA